MLSLLDELLWAVIGVLLTISGVFIEGAIPLPTPTWPLALDQVQTYPLGVTLQVGAVLLVGCLGGKNAAALSQIVYLILGLSGLQVFSYGGGLDYWQQPTFGYLLGFLPGTWVCGYLAFRQPQKLELLAISCLGGLMVIHATGILYLGGLSLLGQLSDSWPQAIWTYSVLALPGQLLILCAVTLTAFLFRRVLLY